MIDHISIEVSSLARSRDFYDAVFTKRRRSGKRSPDLSSG